MGYYHELFQSQIVKLELCESIALAGKSVEGEALTFKWRRRY